MTSKKRRQRGSRTHGGGTHKNRRGAGNRGGRGRAGRTKHNMHGYEPIGKSGFTRHGTSTTQLATVSLGELDAAVAAAIAAGEREAGAGPHAVDATAHVDGDAVKVLGGGQVHHPLAVSATGFSETAIAKLEAAGGEAIEES